MKTRTKHGEKMPHCVLASASMDSTMQVWDVSGGEKLASYERHSRPITALIWLPHTLQDDASVALPAEHIGAAGRNGAQPDQSQAASRDDFALPPLYTRIFTIPLSAAARAAPPVSDAIPAQEEPCPVRESRAIPAAGVPSAVTGQ